MLLVIDTKIKQTMSINITADFGQKFYRLRKSVAAVAELNKTLVSKMRGSHVWGLCCLTGLQNLICAGFLLKKQLQTDFRSPSDLGRTNHLPWSQILKWLDLLRA